MSINSVGSYYAQNYEARSREHFHSSVSDGEFMGNATSPSKSSDNGKRIGITTVGNVGYIAMYADSSTEQDPIIKVGDVEVRIKDVNPNSATKIEMFALMSYMDDKGLSHNKGMKSFNKMTAYSAQAEYNGYCSGISDETAAWTVKRDWIGILGSAKETFLGNSQTYKQGLECEKLIGYLEKWSKVSTYSEADAIDNIQKYTSIVPVEGEEDEIFEGVVVAEDSVMAEMLSSESTSCTYPSDDAERGEIRYITWYTEEGIFCRKAGQTEGYAWSVSYENREQYDKVMAFIKRIPPDCNWRFTASKNFWQDFLNDEIDMERFEAFLETTNQGVPDFENNKNDFEITEKEKMQWSEYFTVEESEGEDYRKIIRERIKEICEKLKNGDTEVSIPIGAESFTEEEWDKLLEEVDDITEEMREAMREEYQKRLEKAMEEDDSNAFDSVDNREILSRVSEKRNTQIKVSNFKEYETANYKFVPEPSIGEGGMRILVNGESVAVFSVNDLKIRVDEKTGTKVLISEIAGLGGAWYDVIPVDAELERGLAEAIGVDDIPEVALKGYYIGIHEETGIQYVMRPGDEGRGGKVLLRNEVDVAKYNALAEEYYNRYPNLVSSLEFGRIYASFEICGMMERTETGFVRIGYDNISYNDNWDYKKNWSVMLTEGTWELLDEWLKENRDYMMECEKFSSWVDVFSKIGGSYERIWSDEELEQGYLNN